MSNSRTNVVPDFVPMFLFLRFCSIFMLFFGIENFLDLISDFPDEEVATELHVEQ
jgi:hypothetical protein